MLSDDEFLQKAAEAIATLEGIDKQAYWRGPIPSPDDEAISRIVDLYVEATPAQREILTEAQRHRRDAAYDTFGLLASYGFRMSMHAVRRHSGSILRYAIIGTVMSMEWAFSDPRDAGANIVPLLSRSALKLGIDIERACAEGAALAADSWTKTCIMPPITDRYGDLRRYGMAEYYGPAGLVYHRPGHPIPDGWLISK